MLHEAEQGLSRGSVVNNLPANAGYARDGMELWVRKIPWRRKWQPTPVSLPGKSRGQRSLMGYSPWGHKELDTAEPSHPRHTDTHTHTDTDTHTHTHTHTHTRCWATRTVYSAPRGRPASPGTNLSTLVFPCSPLPGALGPHPPCLPTHPPPAPWALRGACPTATPCPHQPSSASRSASTRWRPTT